MNWQWLLSIAQQLNKPNASLQPIQDVLLEQLKELAEVSI
jgi:hypothetical protein